MTVSLSFDQAYSEVLALQNALGKEARPKAIQAYDSLLGRVTAGLTSLQRDERFPKLLTALFSIREYLVPSWKTRAVELVSSPVAKLAYKVIAGATAYYYTGWTGFGALGTLELGNQLKSNWSSLPSFNPFRSKPVAGKISSLVQANEDLEALLQNKISLPDNPNDIFLYFHGEYQKNLALQGKDPVFAKFEQNLVLYYDTFVAPPAATSVAPAASIALPTVPLVAKAASVAALGASAPEPLPVLGISNHGANCWVNALMHLLNKNIHLKNWLLSNQCPPQLLNLQVFLKAYDSDKKAGRAVCSVSSESIRQSIRLLATQISASGHECAHEGLMKVMGLLPSLPSNRSPLLSSYTTFRYFKLHEQPEPNDPSLIIQVDPTKGVRYGVTEAPAEEDWGNVRLQLPSDQDNSLARGNGFREILDGKALMMHYFSNGSEGPGRRCYTSALGPNGLPLEHRYPQIGEARLFREAPPYLTVNPVRFEFDRNTNTSYKKNSPIDMPLEVEIPGEYLSSSTPVKYQLEVIVIHSGSTHGGHYNACVNEGGKWYEANDSFVSEVADIKSKAYNGYIYQYRRVD